MSSTDDLRKTLTDPKPLYFAAGVLDKIREEAPERIAAVRATDPKEVQARVTKQAKETQAKVSETLGGIDTDIKKLREQAQHLALQSVGVAAEYAVKARETYDELADRGRGAVKNWRGEEEAPQVTVEREPVKIAEPPAEPRGSQSAAKTRGQGQAGGQTRSQSGTKSTGSASSAAKSTDSAARKTTTAKTTTDSKPGTSASTAKSSSASKTSTSQTSAAKTNGSKKSNPKSGS